MAEWPHTEGTLKPGERVTASGRYGPTQAHIDAGILTDTLVVRGEGPGGSRQDPADDVIHETTFTLPLQRRPSVNLIKVGETPRPTSPPRAGQIIAMVFAVANNGNTTLTDVALADSPRAVAPSGETWPGTPGTLAPGQAMTGTLAYRITQTTIDAGHLVATPVATAERPGGNPSNHADDVHATVGISIPLKTVTELTLSATPDLSGAADPPTAGHEMAIRYTVSNTGNTTVSDIAVTDPLLTSPPVFDPWPGAERALLPGQSVAATGTHTLGDPEVDARSVNTVARVDGERPGGKVANPTDNVEATYALDVALRPAHGLDLVAGAIPSVPAAFAVGQPVAFTLVASNTGNQPLRDVALRSVTLASRSAASSIRAGGWPSAGQPGLLMPGETRVWTAIHQVTQGDVDAGLITFAGEVHARTRHGSAITPAAAQAVLAHPQTSQLTFTATASRDRITQAPHAGQAIGYTYRIVNTGATTLNGLRLTDPALRGPAVFGTWPDPAEPGTLAPGEWVNATGSAVLIQPQVDAGFVTSTAVVRAERPSGAPSVDTDDVVATTRIDTVLRSATGLRLTVRADASGLKTPCAVGQVIAHEVEIANTGTVTLTDVGLDLTPGLHHRLAGSSWPRPDAAGILRPGEVARITVRLVLTQADIDAGHVAVTARGHGLPAGAVPSEVGRAIVHMAAADTPVGYL
ncbi:MAG: hypothetical protein LBK59_07775 [Bifidobacteriaceae bacterium]|jgi:hypothetical protein|nr:hypothetical protein [Bifidobacteriaceae bacterium]